MVLQCRGNVHNASPQGWTQQSVEVGEFTDATHKGDMGFLDEDTFFALCRTSRNCFTAMEGSEQFSWGNAKVGTSIS